MLCIIYVRSQSSQNIYLAIITLITCSFPSHTCRLEREIILKQNVSVFKTTFADKLLLKYLQNSFFQVNGPCAAERSHGTKLPN